MSLQKKFKYMTSLTGDEFLKFVAELSDIENQYINARLNLDLAKNMLKEYRASPEKYKTISNALPKIKSKISQYKQLVNHLESSQHLAVG